VNLDAFLGLAGSVGARRHCCAETNLGSKWSRARPRADRRFQFSNSAFAFLRLVSHMTTLRLESHWNAQIPFPGPILRIVSKFTRPLSLLEGGVCARDYHSVRMSEIFKSLMISNRAALSLAQIKRMHTTIHKMRT
jgi:hypothetical protein